MPGLSRVVKMLCDVCGRETNHAVRPISKTREEFTCIECRTSKQK
jgi:hypothetical protein